MGTSGIVYAVVFLWFALMLFLTDTKQQLKRFVGRQINSVHKRVNSLRKRWKPVREAIGWAAGDAVYKNWPRYKRRGFAEKPPEVHECECCGSC